MGKPSSPPRRLCFPPLEPPTLTPRAPASQTNLVIGDPMYRSRFLGARVVPPWTSGPFHGCYFRHGPRPLPTVTFACPSGASFLRLIIVAPLVCCCPEAGWAACSNAMPTEKTVGAPSPFFFIPFLPARPFPAANGPFAFFLLLRGALPCPPGGPYGPLPA